MIEVRTFPGKTYAVTSANGCTVTTEDGTTLVEAEAGKQAYFVAVGGKVVLIDDAAIVTQVFKLAPYQKLRLLGVVGGGDPAWLTALREELTAMLDGSKFELAWLAAKKQLVVHTDRVDEAMLEAVKATAEAAAPAGAEVVQYNHHIEVSWRDINKYAECTNRTDMLAVNPDYIHDLTSDGEWVYPLPKLKSSIFYDVNLQYINMEFPSVKDAEGFFYGIKTLKKAIVKFPIATNAYMMFRLSGIKELEIHYGANCDTNCQVEYTELEKLKLIAPKSEKINTWGCPLKELSVDIPNVKNFSGTSNQLNKESALCVLGQLRNWNTGSTYSCKIGIHIDHKNDEEVLAAIANAEANGWTMKVQWIGTPTATASVTYGLRKPPIYARVSEMEHPDGTTERVLDWGHYVTDPTGYEEFSSVEEAREHYGLPAEESFS